MLAGLRQLGNSEVFANGAAWKGGEVRLSPPTSIHNRVSRTRASERGDQTNPAASPAAGCGSGQIHQGMLIHRGIIAPLRGRQRRHGPAHTHIHTYTHTHKQTTAYLTEGRLLHHRSRPLCGVNNTTDLPVAACPRRLDGHVRQDDLSPARVVHSQTDVLLRRVVQVRQRSPGCRPRHRGTGGIVHLDHQVVAGTTQPPDKQQPATTSVHTPTNANGSLRVEPITGKGLHPQHTTTPHARPRQVAEQNYNTPPPPPISNATGCNGQRHVHAGAEVFVHVCGQHSGADASRAGRGWLANGGSQAPRPVLCRTVQLQTQSSAQPTRARTS